MEEATKGIIQDMKEISIRAKGIIAVIILTCITITSQAIWKEYKLEEDLKACRAAVVEELTESPAKVVQLRTLDGKSLELKHIPEARAEADFIQLRAEEEIEEIAPVQAIFIAHDEIPLAAEYQAHIESECERMEVDPGYIYALIESESSFRTSITVEDGGGHSTGLCQINSVNWPEMEKKGLDPKNEFDNITFCISLVKKYMDKYPSMDHVTTCYKAGEGGAKGLNYHLAVCDTINERTEYFNNILKGGTENGEN